MNFTENWFDDLYMKHSKRMVTIAIRLGFTKEEGEDIVQDAFLLLLSKAETFQQGHDNPVAFLYTIERHLIGDALRRRKRWQFTSYETLLEAGTADTYFASLKDNLLPGLSETDREILIAFYDEQVPYDELSKRLGVSESQCRLKVFRAKNRYRKILQEKNKR